MADKHWLQLSQGKQYAYSIVRSNRAKYIRVKLSNSGQLTLVLPKGVALRQGLEFLQTKISWVEKHLKNCTYKPHELPTYLDLSLLKETWKVTYLDVESDRISLTEKENYLLSLSGNINENKKSTQKLINKWLQHKARKVFQSLLDDVARKYGFNYKKLSIRSQKTRWGSCSQNKNISLNSKLLFFNQEIVTYVMIHELCHTIEMNHSERFWNLVKACDPDYLHHKKALKEDGKLIPIE